MVISNINPNQKYVLLSLDEQDGYYSRSEDFIGRTFSFDSDYIAIFDDSREERLFLTSYSGFKAQPLPLEKEVLSGIDLTPIDNLEPFQEEEEAYESTIDTKRYEWFNLEEKGCLKKEDQALKDEAFQVKIESMVAPLIRYGYQQAIVDALQYINDNDWNVDAFEIEKHLESMATTKRKVVTELLKNEF